MNSPDSFGLHRRMRWFFALILTFVFPVLGLHAQPTTGTINGRVFNPATGEYVRNAEVRLEGTNKLVTTESDGSFTFENVPSGQATVSVTYTGYNTAKVNVTVPAGAAATTEVNLTSTLQKPESPESPVKLERFVVSGEREGNAKAIMDQKQSMNVSNIVAADAFGNISEGNIGEFIKYLPGIQMDYVEADARSPRIRGLPAQYTSVTFNGMDIASADAFIQNNGTDNGGGAGAGGRSFGFEQVSMSSIDAVEVNFTTNASQGAGSAAGNINLRPKHAFQRKGQLVSFDLSLMGNSEQLYWRKTVGPDDASNRKIMPSLLVEYANSFFHNKLGIILSINESNAYNEQRQFQPSYDTTPTPTDPRPVVVTRIQYKDGPKFNERTTGSFTVDYRVTNRLALSLIGTINYYRAFVGNRTFGVSTNRANTLGTDGFTSWVNVPVTGLTSTMSYLNKRTHGYTYMPTFEYKLPNLLVDGSFVYSVSENNYNGGQSKSLPGNSVGGTSLSTTGMTVTAWRPADDLYSWHVVQTGGLDWGNISNYKASATGTPTFSIDGRYNRNIIYQGRLDVKYSAPWTRPTYFKTGGRVSETSYIFRNPTAWQTYSYVGPGGGAGGSWALFPSGFEFSQGHGGSLTSISGGTPAVQDHNAIGYLFKEHPEYFIQNGSAGNFLTAFVAQPRYIREQVDALYGMFDTKPISALELQAGVRWERTRDETKDWDPLGSAQVTAAGYTVTNGQATTIPGIQYQYFTNPRTAHSKKYGALFPSGSIKYDFSRNLQALFGYSYTVTRPAYGDLSGVYTENDTTQEITAPNPNLKPQYANNYSARLSYYFEPAGSFAIGAFENDFKNFAQTTTSPGIAADFGYTDPLYDTYKVTTKQNIAGTVVYRGATFEYRQTLSFLPVPLKGLTIFANVTRTYKEIKVPDQSLLHVAGPYNFGWLPGIAPYVVNYGVDFTYRSLSLGVKARWTDKMPTTGTYNTWMQQNTKIDASASYRLTNKYSIYFNARNLLNVPDHTFTGTDTTRIAGGRQFEYYGAYIYAGLKGKF
jgi:iron complex outermembrane recepter protein